LSDLAVWPDVAVIVPVRNGAGDLVACLDAVTGQDYPGRLEVVVAVGSSDDDTAAVAAEVAARDGRVRVVDNPAGGTASALNAAIAATSARVIARVDAHAVVPPDYVRQAVQILQDSGADNVGGVQQATGSTPFEHAVARAMSSRFGVGNAAFHYGGQPGPTDTVYLGVFRCDALTRVGGFDETLVRNQDYELNWRIRRSGGVVWFDPSLRVRYRPRSTLRGLARQYLEYGRWKRVVLRRHPSSARVRQLIAPAAVVANGVALLLGVTVHRRFLTVPGLYTASVLVASAVGSRGLSSGEAARLPAVYATMHHAWGIGFLTSPRRLADPAADDPSL
jgi:cellulose synthase/poly-beta-1,6-N-acetylglucosamine synthase-like glycosyltransferase